MDKQFTKMINMLMGTVNIPSDAPSNNVSVFLKDVLTNILDTEDTELKSVIDMIKQVIILNANTNPELVLKKLVEANRKFEEFYNSE